MTVTEFLRDLGLSQYAAKFSLNDIDESVLPLLTKEDLISVGVISLGHQRLILERAKSLRHDAAETIENIPEHAERRLVTMVFCDLVGFTSLAEKLDLEDLTEVVESFRSVCRTTVSKYKGTIVNFMGDGIMAAFGYPQSFENDSARAVDAALELLETIGSLKTPLGESIPARAGVNTGVVVIGELANKNDVDKIMVIGKAPNRAARVQALAAPGEVLISENTRRVCRGRHLYEDRFEHRLKGIETPIRVWRALPGRTLGLNEVVHVLPNAGRVDELATLNRAWDDVLQLAGNVVLVEGEPGIGKSRLVWAFREQHLGQPIEVFEFLGKQLLETSAFNVLNDHVSIVSGINPDDDADARREKLAAMFECEEDDPELIRLVQMLLAEKTAGGAGPQDPPAGFKEWYFGNIRRRMERLAGDRPILVVLDDTHWADPTSLEFFAELVNWAMDKAVLVIGAGRPNLVEKWPAVADAEIISLEPMDDGSIQTMLESLPADLRPSQDDINEVVSRAGGNPYFALELVRSSAADQESTIPTSLLETLVSQIDKAGGDRSVALHAACIGQRFDANLLTTIMNSTPKKTRAALEKLAQLEIAFPDVAAGEDAYFFRHSLVQETAYEVLLRPQKREIHGAIATALADGESVTAPSVVAHHFAQARMHLDAARWYHRAAEFDLAVGGYNEVMQALDSARSELAKIPVRSADSRQVEIQVLTALGSTLLVTAPQASSDIKDAYDLAYALTLETPGSPETGPVLFGLAAYFFFRGELTRTQNLCAQLVELAEALGAGDMAAGAQLMSHQSEFWRGNGAQLLEKGEQMLPPRDMRPEGGAHHARYAQDPQVTSRITHVWALNIAGRHKDGEKEANWALDYARSIDHPFTIAQAYQCLAWHHIVCGNVSEANKASGKMLDMAEKYGMMMLIDIASIQSLWSRDMEGEISNGHRLIGDVLDRWIMTEAHIGVRACTALLAEVALKHGDFEYALPRVENALKMDQSEDGCYNAELYRLCGCLRVAIGADHGKILQAFDQAIKEAEDRGQYLFALKAATNGYEWAIQNMPAKSVDYRQKIDMLLEIYPQSEGTVFAQKARLIA